MVIEPKMTKPHWVSVKLQALVYDILPSTTAVFSYAIGSRKVSANEQFFVGVQTVVSLLQTTHYIRRLFYNWPCCLYASSNKTQYTPAQIKPKSFESRRNSSSFSFFYPGGGGGGGGDAPHVYARASALGW